jgi:CelD/BcsL family acetyltransferase involved in cellulose biosynthesis
MNAVLRPIAPYTSAATGPSPVRFAVWRDVAAAQADWRALESQDSLLSPYQRYDFLEPWSRHRGPESGLSPFLLVGYDAADAPVMLLPLGERHAGPLRVVHFPGGRHANFNMALWRRDAATAVTQADLGAMRDAIAAAGIDLIALTNQPQRWGGLANPLALWPHQESPSAGAVGALSADFAALQAERLAQPARKKLRKKERTLGEHGTLLVRRAETDTEARAFLDAFFTQKAERMGKLGIPDAFAAPGTREFIAELATARPNGRLPILETYALRVGDEIVATMAGLVEGQRFSALFNSITSGPLSHESPGDVLLTHVVRLCCERGLTQFDLGVGEAAYKRFYCNETEPLFDTFLALTPLGRLGAAGIRTAQDAKRLVKHSPMLWQAVQSLRKLRAQFTQR